MELIDELIKQASDSWDALKPIRDTWNEKEQTLLAKTSDSFSGNVTRARVTDAALSTLSFERAARVAAQLPTGQILPAGKKDKGKAKLANLVLQRYIVPNANSQHDMMIKQRLWGVYASVYGSMPMFYDYRVDDQYIGPDCWLVDPRNFLPQPGRNSIEESDWAMISTLVSVKQLERIAERKNTTWSKEALKTLIKKAKDGKPSRVDDTDKDSYTSRTRYTKDAVKGQVELITRYEAGADGKWITFAPDYKEAGILREIKNPHKSGRIPVVMRHCFPLMNSIYGLGDYERGIRIQKAKDSLLGLKLEFVKNRVFPPLKINAGAVTMSTIKYGAGRKWLMTDMNAVQPMTFGQESGNEFRDTYQQLQGIIMNQFGTSDTTMNAENSGSPAFGKTPQALAMLQQRENARDTWDRFMHEKAVEELYEGMVNLLSCKMEKPIDFTVFEEDIRLIVNDYGEDVLEAIDGNKIGKLTIQKSDIYSNKGFRYVIDANSSMKKDDEAQLQALLNTWQLAHQDPNFPMKLMQQGLTYDEAEHFKKILISAGISDWETILQEQTEGGAPNPAMVAQLQMQQQMEQEQMMQQAQFQDPEIQDFANQILSGGMEQPPQAGMM